MKRFISILLCAVIIFSLTACSFTSSNAVFTIGVTDSVNTFDPMLAETEAELLISANCFEGLLRFDEQGKITLAGATAYTIGKHGLSYIFKLNPNAQWHMNSETKDTIKTLGLKDFNATVTADDFVAGFEKFKEASEQLDIIKDMKATDDFTLEITLREKDDDFLHKLASLPLYPCSKAFYEATEDIYATTPAMVLFNGPYYVAVTTESETTIERNPDYNGNIQIKNKQVSIYTGKAEEDISEGFNNGSYNVYISDCFTDELKVKESSSVSFDNVWGIAFNCKSKLGSSKAFREILFGSISSPYAITLPAFATDRAETVFPPTFTICDSVYSDFENDVKYYEADTKKAVKSLNALQKKYKVDSYSVTFAVPYDVKATAEKMVEDWKELFGDKITVKISLYNKEDAHIIAQEGAYDIGIMPLSPEINTANALFDSITQAPCYYESKKLISLKKDLSTVASENFEIYNQAEEHLIENSVFIPLFYTGKSLYISENLTGVYTADGGKLVYFYSGEEM